MLVALGAGISGFALSKSIPLSCILLFVSGAVSDVRVRHDQFACAVDHTNDMRGRVMSVYNVAFRGGMPFGSVLTGYLVPSGRRHRPLDQWRGAAQPGRCIFCWCSGAWQHYR